MVEMSQFGSVPPGSAQVCGRCEALLMDVLDGTASGEDQEFFEGHVTSCTGCSQMLADARRGGAWLEMLRDPRPVPPAALFERILAQTSGSMPSRVVETTPRAGAMGLHEGAAAEQAYAGVPTGPLRAGAMPGVSGGGLKVLPFRVRSTVHRLSEAMLQPRLAMTAAMAFFSIALTLNLTGVHVNELRLSELRPANLRREFYQANAHVVRYCDNLRVVYELEARAHDLQRSSDSDGPGRDDGQGSGSEEPSDGKQPRDKPAEPKPAPKAGAGTSRREPSIQDSRVVAAVGVDGGCWSSRTPWKGDQA